MDTFFYLHDKLMEKERPTVPNAGPEPMFVPVDQAEEKPKKKPTTNKKKTPTPEPVEEETPDEVLEESEEITDDSKSDL